MNKSFRIVFILLFLCLFSTNVSARSLYVIGNRYVGPNFPLLSFDIQPEAITYQEHLPIPNHGTGAYDITADEENEILFLSFRNDPTIELVNAKLLTSVGYATLEGLTNPAGTVFAKDQNYLLILQQNTNHLYVYMWDSTNKTFTALYEDPYYVELLGVSYGQDLTLDDEYDVLYVADSSQFDVHSFYLDTWSDAGCTTLQHKPTIIQLDEEQGFMYSADGTYGSKIIQYNMFDGSSKSYTIDTDSQAMDIAVDRSTGFVYVTLNYTSGINNMIVLTSDLEYFSTITENIEYPSGVYIPKEDIGYNPFNLKIDDNVHTWISPGGEIQYTISYGNLLNYPLENTELFSYLPPSDEASFVSCTDQGTYSTVDNMITWDLGTIAAGAELLEVHCTVLIDNSVEDLQTLLDQTVISSGSLSSTKEIYTLVRNKKPINDGYFDPNPYNPDFDEIGYYYPNFTYEEALITSMIIYDEAGEKVLERENISFSDLNWNGRNEAGKLVENGVYFAVIKNAEGEKNIIKVALLR